jgi:hypothetical protein
MQADLLALESPSESQRGRRFLTLAMLAQAQIECRLRIEEGRERPVQFAFLAFMIGEE